MQLNSTTTFRSLLALAASLLALQPVAKAQLTFTVNEFTTDTLSITINAGSLLTTDGCYSPYADTLSLVDPAGFNTGWANDNQSISSGGASFGSLAFESALAWQDWNDQFGDYLVFTWAGDLSTAGNLASSQTFVFNSPGLFNPDNVHTWDLYWGDPVFQATLQSTGDAVTGGGSAPVSAVPEPGTYAALAGLAALGFAVRGRRRTASTTAVCSA
jgi:hypothetical protein